jgi:DNA mismatch repair protein MutS
LTALGGADGFYPLDRADATPAMATAPEPERDLQRPRPLLAPVGDLPHDTVGPAGAAHGFRSVLFGDLDAAAQPSDPPAPTCFADLNLDQVVRAVIARKGAYNLAPFFHTPLRDLDTIRLRQEVFADLEQSAIAALAVEFAERELVARYHAQLRSLREEHQGFSHYHRARAFLGSAITYCDTVERLRGDLDDVALRARGLIGLHEYLAGYLHSDAYQRLQREARSLEQALGEVRYAFLLKGPRITVGPYDEQPDYSREVLATFERFQQDAPTNYLPEFRDWDTYAAIGVLHLVAQVYPELFAQLDQFCASHSDYLDPTVATFDRELQFYLAYLDYIKPIRERGLPFSSPRMSTVDKTEQALETFDLALAAQPTKDERPIVGNNLQLRGGERVLVITGPNNGGKTTFARTVGQLHYLARLGCPVPGRDTQLFLCDEIFTHFERQEDIETLAGKLQDELNRLRDALEGATPHSLFVLNEMFNSTTAQDALFLSREILRRVSDLDALCVCVTFLDELAALDEKTVSMVSSVDPDDPAIRTYKLVRRRADGRAYARAIAEKYGLTYERLTARRRQ